MTGDCGGDQLRIKGLGDCIIDTGVGSWTCVTGVIGCKGKPGNMLVLTRKGRVMTRSKCGLRSTIRPCLPSSMALWRKGVTGLARS